MPLLWMRKQELRGRNISGLLSLKLMYFPMHCMWLSKSRCFWCMLPWQGGMIPTRWKWKSPDKDTQKFLQGPSRPRTTSGRGVYVEKCFHLPGGLLPNLRLSQIVHLLTQLISQLCKYSEQVDLSKDKCHLIWTWAPASQPTVSVSPWGKTVLHSN